VKVNDLIDQSGLSPSYTSGVTDFNSYTSSATHAFLEVSNAWVSNTGNPTGIITFDLGSTHSIEAFALWNHNFPNSINDFELLADTDGSFGNGGTTSLGSFNAAPSLFFQLRHSLSAPPQLNSFT